MVSNTPSHLSSDRLGIACYLRQGGSHHRGAFVHPLVHLMTTVLLPGALRLGKSAVKALHESARLPRMNESSRRSVVMSYVAGALAIVAGVFCSVGLLELGAPRAELCQYGTAFCDKPLYLLFAVGLAAAWGVFVSVR